MTESMAVKVARLEEQMINNQSQLNRVENSVSKIDDKVDKLLSRFETTAQSFMTRKEYLEESDKVAQSITEEFNGKIQKARDFNWITHTASAIVGFALSAIVYFIIQNFVR